MTDTALIVCRDCDLVCRDPSEARAARLRCPRCGFYLRAAPSRSLDAALALALTAAILLLILNTNPLLSIRLQGTSRDATLLGAARAMWSQGMRPVALLVLATTVIVPALQIGAELWLLANLRRGGNGPTQGLSMRAIGVLRPWGMVEVFLLGLLVSMVKLQSVAEVILGPALWSCGVLIFVMAGLASMLHPHSIRQWAQGGRHA
jgi:paraquat-inducible protein A